jgi:hypothetical protein
MGTDSVLYPRLLESMGETMVELVTTSPRQAELLRLEAQSHQLPDSKCLQMVVYVRLLLTRDQ